MNPIEIVLSNHGIRLRRAAWLAAIQDALRGPETLMPPWDACYEGWRTWWRRQGVTSAQLERQYAAEMAARARRMAKWLYRSVVGGRGQTLPGEAWQGPGADMARLYELCAEIVAEQVEADEAAATPERWDGLA